MLYVGLTGQVASGKSTVARYFQELGINLINADQISKELTHSSSYLFSKIIEYFGDTIVAENGELHRKKLRDIIFNTKEKRLWLENLLHPAIREEIDRQRKDCNSAYCMIEIPLLTDRTLYPYLDRVLLVLSDEAIRITRLTTRDDISEHQARLIIENQEAEDIYKSIADDIIYNNDDLISLKQAVIQLHEKYLSLCGNYHIS